jgi:hypothetical protein
LLYLTPGQKVAGDFSNPRAFPRISVALTKSSTVAPDQKPVLQVMPLQLAPYVTKRDVRFMSQEQMALSGSSGSTVHGLSKQSVQGFPLGQIITGLVGASANRIKGDVIV